MSADIRIGTGYDLHRLTEGRPLVLGGVTIPYERGALGHSDADALLHAVTDALLGAAALGDIGTHFPDTDEKYRGADSRVLLATAWELVRSCGYLLLNLDCTVFLQEPHISPYVDAMRRAIAACLACDASVVSVKAKTGEHIGVIGTGEAVASACTVLLVKAE